MLQQDDGKILGMDKDDFEKIVLSLCLLATTAVSLYVYLTLGHIDTDMIYLVGLFLTAFITRKGLSYWKPERYKKQRIEEKELDIIKIQEYKENEELELSVYSNDDSPI
jgi:hypothetical protein